MFRCLRWWILILSLCLAAAPAGAGNGHYLHGIGVVNSSMGGAGTGLPTDVISALHANPALLTQLDGYEVAISAEAFVDDLKLTTEVPGIWDRHTTESDGELGVLPALGWSMHQPGKKLAIGWGLLAVAGFRTNWPVDPESALLAPQPLHLNPNGFEVSGFGRLQTELSVTKIPFALAWQVTDKLSLGLGFDLFQSRLNITPLPVVPPDCTNADGVTPADIPYNNLYCIRPTTTNPVTRRSFGLQLGLYYVVNPKLSLGFSYTTEQGYSPYEWQSEHANPNLPDYLQARNVEIDIDQPDILSLGVGFRPTPKLKLAFDYRWMGYNDQEGIGGSGGVDEFQRLISIGWQDISIWMLGVEFQAGPKLVLRAGLNFNDSPIKPELTLNSGGTPSVFEEHYTIGLGVDVSPNLQLNIGAYYTPPNKISGPLTGNVAEEISPGVWRVPFLDGTNGNPDSTFTLENEILSGLFGFTFRF